MNNTQGNRKKVAAKIGAIIFVIILVIGVWIYKNVIQTSEEVEVDQLQNSLEDEHINPSSIEGYFPLHVTEEIDLEMLKSYGLPIIIDFGADSCIPCKEMAPVLEKLNADLAGKAIILFVDVWKYQDLALDYPVQVIPTQILIDSEGNPYVPGENINMEFIQYAHKETNEHIYTTHQGGLTEEQMLLILNEMGIEE